MAPSWNELSSDHKIVFLLEGLQTNNGPNSPVACRICNQVCLDNKSLLDHFQSHFYQNVTSNARTQAQSLASPENGTKFFSSSAQSTHSSPVPMNVHNSGGVRPYARGSIPPTPPNRLLMGNYPNPKHLPNSVQLRGTTLTHCRPQSYPSSSIIRPSMGQHTFASQTNQPANFHLMNFKPPIGFTTPGIITSQHTNFHFSSNAGTSGIARGTTTRPLVATVRENEIENISSGYTKPYIMQLEQPIGEMMLGKSDVGGNPDEMDLTLKL